MRASLAAALKEEGFDRPRGTAVSIEKRMHCCEVIVGGQCTNERIVPPHFTLKGRAEPRELPAWILVAVRQPKSLPLESLLPEKRPYLRAERSSIGEESYLVNSNYTF